MTRVRLLVCLSFILPIWLLGCSKNSQAPARLSGSVTYKGQPLKAGTMQLHAPDGVAYNAQIGEDGTYIATDIPEGELVITVETESFNPTKKAAGGKDAEKRLKAQQPPPPGRGSGGGTPADLSEHYVKIPEKYSNPKTSPLTVTVKSGRQVHNVALE
jgi:hypothetical protein